MSPMTKPPPWKNTIVGTGPADSGRYTRIGMSPAGPGTVASSVDRTVASVAGSRSPTVIVRKPSRACSGVPSTIDGVPVLASRSRTAAIGGSSGMGPPDGCGDPVSPDVVRLVLPGGRTTTTRLALRQLRGRQRADHGIRHEQPWLAGVAVGG